MPELARILFQTKRKWIIIFPTFKDKIQVFWHYDIIYKFKCGESRKFSTIILKYKMINLFKITCFIIQAYGLVWIFESLKIWDIFSY